MSLEQLRSHIWSEILAPLITLLLAAATIVFIWGLVEFIANSGNEEARSKGKTHMIWGVFGLFLMLSVWGIVQIFCNFFGTCGYLK